MSSTYYVEVAAALTRTRQAKGMTFAAVERLSEGRIRKEALASWERTSGPNARRPQLEHLAQLAEFYEVPITTFIPGQRENTETMVPLSAVIAHIKALGGVADSESLDADTPPTGTATDCDGCGDPIAYGVTVYAVPTGAEEDGKPVVRILCAQCREAQPRKWTDWPGPVGEVQAAR